MNQKDVEMLSELDRTMLEKMDEMSEIFNVFEIESKAAAFILAFKDGCEYWSDNYRYFDENYSNFIYIDRIVIDESLRKQGIARKLYENIFKYASQKNYDYLCAEIDIKPEYNYPSMKFHKKMGFVEVGQRISKKTITVSLQIREIGKSC